MSMGIWWEGGWWRQRRPVWGAVGAWMLRKRENDAKGKRLASSRGWVPTAVTTVGEII